MEDKKFTDASLEEISVMLHNSRNSNNGEKNICEFLNSSSSSSEEVFKITESYPIYKLPLFCYFVPKLFEDKKFELVKLVAHAYERFEDISPSYTQIELDSVTTADVVLYGDYYIIKENKKFVIFIDFMTSNCCGHITVFSSKENAAEASKIISDLESYIKTNNFLKGKKITPVGKFLKLRNKYSWEDAIFLKDLKDEIQMNIEKYFKNLSIYKENGLPTKRGILLTGSPGVGKTQLGKVLVSTLENITFIWVTPKYFKDFGGDRGVEMLFELANELAPSLLFLEDVDFYGTSRDYGNNSTVLGEFLNKIDGIVENGEVLILMTTNYPELLDKAIKERPGRFDRVIQIAPPGIEERETMFKRFCKDLKVNGINWNELYELSEGFTGASIKELIITASGFAIEDRSLDENNKVILTQNHFDKAFATLKKYSKLNKKSSPGFRRFENYEDSKEELCNSRAPVEAGSGHPYRKDTGEIE